MFNIFTDLKTNSKQENILILLSLSIFMPFYFTACIFIAFCIYTLCTKQMQEVYKSIKGTKWILLFTILSVITSLFYKNYVGVGCSFIILALLSVSLYFGKYGNQKVLKQILKIYLWMSIICGILAVFQYKQILRLEVYYF